MFESEMSTSSSTANVRNHTNGLTVEQKLQYHHHQHQHQHQHQQHQQQHLTDSNVLSLDDAQRTTLVRIRALVDAACVSSLLELRNELRHRVGGITRDVEGSRTCAFNPASVWETLWLHTDGCFTETNLGVDFLQKVADVAWKADRDEHWGLLHGKEFNKNVNVRCVELHTYTKGGGLAHTKHNDTGSLVTVDVMLNGDFEGAEFQTLEANGEMKKYIFDTPGDAVAFVSHKYHCVAPLTRGMRQVIVVEFWEGPSRVCAHRCLDATVEKCPYTHSKNVREAMILMRQR